MILWGEQGPSSCIWALDAVVVGSKIDVVVDIFSCDDQVLIGKTWPCQKLVRIHGLSSIDGASSVSLLQVVMKDTQGVVTLMCDEGTKILPLMIPSRSDLT